jgi:hypothetical protein
MAGQVGYRSRSTSQKVKHIVLEKVLHSDWVLSLHSFLGQSSFVIIYTVSGVMSEMQMFRGQRTKFDFASARWYDGSAIQEICGRRGTSTGTTDLLEAARQRSAARSGGELFRSVNSNVGVVGKKKLRETQCAVIYELVPAEIDDLVVRVDIDL